MNTALARISIVALLLLWFTGQVWSADAQYVIHISLDGCRGDLLAAQLAQDTSGELANFQRFVDEGATTFNARTDYAYTNTLPNHTTILTARPVAQPVGQPNTVHHGYTSNSTPGASVTLHNGGNANVDYIASVFDVVHDAGGSTALYASKEKFILFDRSYDATHGAADPQPPDNGSDKIDRYLYDASGSSAPGMHATFLTEMGANHYNYCFVHYLDLDAVGHASGWGSAAWNAALRTLDGYLGDIFSLVTSDAQLSGNTVIILTADHGGVGTSHSATNRPEVYTIPVFAWGAGVAQGVDLYGMNTTSRSDPGTGRPDYNAQPQPIRNGDTANLALQALGLAPIPDAALNAAQDLKLNGTTAAQRKSWSDVKQQYHRR